MHLQHIIRRRNVAVVVVGPANDPATRDNFAAAVGPGSGPDASQMKDASLDPILDRSGANGGWIPPSKPSTESFSTMDSSSRCPGQEEGDWSSRRLLQYSPQPEPLRLAECQHQHGSIKTTTTTTRTTFAYWPSGTFWIDPATVCTIPPYGSGSTRPGRGVHVSTRPHVSRGAPDRPARPVGRSLPGRV
jgi:hypothetical protein